MKRRRALALTALFVSGCIEGESGPTSRDDPPTSASETGTATTADDTTETETPSPVPSTTGDDCEWPVMCEGSTLVEVAVRSGFSGDVVLEVACRKEQYAVQPGETVRIDRETDGETCEVTLSVDDEVVYDESIPNYKRVTLIVKANGDVANESIVY